MYLGLSADRTTGSGDRIRTMPMSWNWKLQGALLATAMVLGAGLAYVAIRPVTPAASVPPDPVPLPVETPPETVPSAVTSIPVPKDAPLPPPPEEVVVLVQGAVDAPGVYRLTEGARVQQGIEAAGGTTPDADLSDINLAAHLLDGSTLHIPAVIAAGMAGDTLVLRRTPMASAMNPPAYTRSGWRPPAPEPAASTAPATAAPSVAPADKRININTASKQELESLPGIGPAFAERIITTREEAPFATVDDLTRVPGIAEKRLESLRAHVRVE